MNFTRILAYSSLGCAALSALSGDMMGFSVGILVFALLDMRADVDLLIAKAKSEDKKNEQAK